MRYFKIIQDNAITDVSFSPMKWSAKYGQMVGCTVAKAQFVQGQITGKTFRDGWMRQTEAAADAFEEADVVEINNVEYNDIYATLLSDEKIEIDPEKPQIPVVPEVHKEEEEKPLSVADMRQIIQNQQEQIEALKEMFAQVLDQQ